MTHAVNHADQAIPINRSTAPDHQAIWDVFLASLYQSIDGLAVQTGHRSQLDFYSSHGLCGQDLEQLREVLMPLLALTIGIAFEAPAVRAGKHKGQVGHTAVTVDLLNDCFFVRLADDGGALAPERLYALQTPLSDALAALHAAGGSFAVERSSPQGNAFTFSWDRREAMILHLPASFGTESAA